MVINERIAIIGAGHVGSTAAYALMLRALVREIVLVDSEHALACAEAADIADANALARPARIWGGTYAEAAQARIVVLTAGAATHGSETRLSVTGQSGVIVRQCVEQLVEHGFDGVLVVASNPADLMSLLAYQCAGLASSRVIGTGTLLDSSRLRQALAEALAVAPASIEAMVLGEHGDSEVALLSGVRIGGVPLATVLAGRLLEARGIADAVRTAGYDIVAGKGYTSYGVATAIVRICEVIVRDEHAVLPVSTLLTGELGCSELYMSLPCIVGAAGVERVLIPEMTEEEATALRASAAVLKAASAAIDPSL